MKIIKDADSVALKEAVIKGMQEVKAKNIIAIDLREVDGAVTDFFVICHGDSSTQVSAIARSVPDVVFKELKQKPWHEEGKANAEWILLDFVDVVVHIFYKEAREFYDIEGLWADAPSEIIEDVAI